MAISIRDVAAKAGVSVGTVSHVLNGNAAARIAPHTQERVRLAARDLGYRPNRVARSLGRRRSDTIGLLVGGLRNSFFVEILETVESLAREIGYHVLLEAAPSRKGSVVGHIAAQDYWPVDGVLMWSPPDRTLTDILGVPYSNTPVVYLGTSRTDATDWVGIDCEAGGRLAGELLLSRGCRRPAYLSPFAFHIAPYEETRNIGFKAVCQAAGVVPTMMLTSEETRAAGVRAGEQIAALPKNERPDGLFCHNDMIAIGVCCALRRAGLRLPEDIAVVGFDGVEEGLFLEIPLTTVELPIPELCRQGLNRLIHKLGGANEGGTGISLSPVLRPGGTA
jgi:LacI family transcriptional regulator